MKYEVIGWTDSDSDEFPMHKDITAPVSAAIVKEIKANGYLFGGDAHETYCPVLNDGTYVNYSWRGWGRVMATANGLYGEYDYMFGYMDSLLDPSARKYPKLGLKDGAKIVPRESLAEIFTIYTSDEMFDALKAGTKTAELRPFDDFGKLIDIGDYIEFRQKGGDESIKRRVADLFIESSFAEMRDRRVFNEKVEWVKQFKTEQFGLPKKCKAKEFTDAMHAMFDKADEKKYGVVAFILEEV